jgi:hypothetical protein
VVLSSASSARTSPLACHFGSVIAPHSRSPSGRGRSCAPADRERDTLCLIEFLVLREGQPLVSMMMICQTFSHGPNELSSTVSWNVARRIFRLLPQLSPQRPCDFRLDTYELVGSRLSYCASTCVEEVWCFVIRKACALTYLLVQASSDLGRPISPASGKKRSKPPPYMPLEAVSQTSTKGSARFR